MPKVTFKSRSPIVLDIPDPKRPNLEFVYNVFTPDEKVNDNAQPVNYSDTIKIAAAMNLNNVQDPTQDQVNAYKALPRFVHISFDPAPEGTSPKNDNSSIQDLYESGMIQTESDVTTLKYEKSAFQDSSLVSRMRENLKFAMNMRLPVHMQVKGSPADYAKNIDLITPEGVENQLILDAITDLANSDPNVGIELNYTNEVGDEAETPFLANQQSEVFDALLHKNFKGDVLRSTVSSPFSPYKKSLITKDYDDDLSTKDGINQLLDTQKTNRADSKPEIDLDEDYQPTIIAASAIKIPNSTSETMLNPAINSSKLMGYIVEKYELGANGVRRGPNSQVNPVPRVFFDNVTQLEGQPVHIFDPAIKYGKIYAYSVRSVYEINLQVRVAPGQLYSGLDAQGGIFVVKFYVQSRPGPEAVVKCDEQVAPAPPDDLTFDYDYQEDALLIGWKMPTNSQNDIKKFQVFKRQSIYGPFRLIAEYNFDNSMIPTPNTEKAHHEHVHYPLDNEGHPMAQNGHMDLKFGRKSSAIYAVCAIDAHGYSSPYSSQLRATFNKKKNNLDVSFVSQPGAPKQYPNFFVSKREAVGWQGLFAETDEMPAEDPNVSNLSLIHI